MKDLPTLLTRIVNDSEFATKYKSIFGNAPYADTRGFVDRPNATIYLSEFPARNFDQTKAGLALHEAVHLFSHPPGKSKALRATVYALLEQGLLEGLTQIITEDIQAARREFARSVTSGALTRSIFRWPLNFSRFLRPR